MQSNNEENANGGQTMNHAEEPLGRTYSQGPVLLRGKMIPSESTSERFLRNDSDTDWLHRDPWRVLRIQAEFVDGFGSLAELGPAVSIFGSARVEPNTKDYKAAVAMGAKIAERDIAVITGGGPGIMEAANKGAAKAGGKSVGLGIELPHEQGLNKWINLGMTFRYFFVRKTMFMKYSSGVIVCPASARWTRPSRRSRWYRRRRWRKCRLCSSIPHTGEGCSIGLTGRCVNGA